MNEISYLDAWHRWLNGENVSGFYLWGLQILWWGRIGKLISFFSALAVVTEIVGPERLRNLGGNLHAKLTFQKVWKTIKNSFRPLYLIIISLIDNSSEGLDAIGEYMTSKASYIGVLLGLLVGAFRF